jgi:hypothetical protein
MSAASSALSASFIFSSMPRGTTRPVRRILTVLTAAATALALMTATALPAHADRSSDNLAKAVVAAVAIGAIVHSIDKGRAKPAPVPQPPIQVRSARVPSACAIELSGARRNITVYPERCLRREGFNYRLPRHCATDARVFGRVDRVYSEDCLRNAGFRVDSGRGHDRGFRDHGRGHGRDHGYGRPRYAY